METAWSSEHARFRDRFVTGGGHRVERPFTPNVGPLLMQPVGPVLLLRSADPDNTRTVRSADAARRFPYLQYGLLYVREGVVRFEQGGVCVVLRNRDCVLFDCNQPYSLLHEKSSECLGFHLPHGWLKSRLANPEEHLGRVVQESTPWKGVLIRFLDAVVSPGVLADVMPGHAVAEQLAGLLVLAFGQRSEDLTRHTRRLYTRLRQTLQNNAHDPDLSAAAVAAMLNISTRYVHSIFAGAATTYGEELNEMRLGRAAELLRDRRFADVSVSEVAFRSGFRDPSHFARRFRKRFGVSPVQYRK